MTRRIGCGVIALIVSSSLCRRAAVDENDAVLANVDGDVRAGAEDDEDVGADLDRFEPQRVGRSLPREHRERPVGRARREQQRHQPRRRDRATSPR
jgi:hypothetical protein